MSDPESPSFTVVDRRRAAQQNAAPEPSGKTAAEESTPSSVPETDTAASTQQAESQAGPTATAESQLEADLSDTLPPTGSDTGQGEQGFLPDPQTLLSLAAMQLDTRDLATLLIGAFDKLAWRGMGLIVDPVTGEPKKDLPAAQLAIDCVEFLFGKVQSSLSNEDRRNFQRRLSDLRLNYLAKVRES